MGVKERYDNLYNYPVGEEPGTDYSGASDLYAGGMNKSLTAALISGGAALAGGAINYFANRENNQSNIELQEMANQHNIDLWRMQTEYNTPANQLTRLRQAGLNPNLLYGNPTNTAGSPPEMKASRNERYALDPMAMANVMLMSKQIQNLDADNEVKQAEARNINANTRGIELDNDRKSFDNSKQGERYNREVREFEQNYSYVYNQILNMAQDTYNKRKDGKIKDEIIKSHEIENAFNEAIKEERLSQFITKGKISKQQLENLKKEGVKLFEEINNLSKQGKILENKYLLDKLNTILFGIRNYSSFYNSPVDYVVDDDGNADLEFKNINSLNSDQTSQVLLQALRRAIEIIKGVNKE